MIALLEKISGELDAYYRDRAKAADTSVQVGWKSRQAQNNRFAQLAKVFPIPGHVFSVGDLGCGLGDFYGYVADMGYAKADYRGYDMAQSMIDGALKVHGGRPGAHFTRISGLADVKPADYFVASGIFNLKFVLPEHEWLYYILATIEALNEKSEKGFAFNALTSYSDAEFRRDELYYADPLFLFDYCKRHFSKDVALLHDYGEYDFTIIVRKSPSQPRNTG